MDWTARGHVLPIATFLDPCVACRLHKTATGQKQAFQMPVVDYWKFEDWLA